MTVTCFPLFMTCHGVKFSVNTKTLLKGAVVMVHRLRDQERLTLGQSSPAGSRHEVHALTRRSQCSSGVERIARLHRVVVHSRLTESDCKSQSLRHCLQALHSQLGRHLCACGSFCPNMDPI